MGEGPSKPIPEKVIDDLTEITQLTKKEVQHSCRKFLAQYPSAVVTLEQFQLLLSNPDRPDDARPYAKHVFRTFNTKGDGVVHLEELLCALSIFKREGEFSDRKLKWAFELFDTHDNKYITREELVEILRDFLLMIKEENWYGQTPEQLADTVVGALDTNNDGKITQHEFIEGVKTNSKMLDVLCTTPVCVIRVRCCGKLNFRF